METVPLGIVKLNRGLIVPLHHANNDSRRRLPRPWLSSVFPAAISALSRLGCGENGERRAVLCESLFEREHVGDEEPGRSKRPVLP